MRKKALKNALYKKVEEYLKRLLLLILPVIILITGIITLFGLFQVQFQEEKLIDELKRRTKALAESSVITARLALINNDKKSLKDLCESFQKRERFQGCIIYDKKGKIITYTERVFDYKNEVPEEKVKNIIDKEETESFFKRYNENQFYIYIMPIKNKEKILGAIQIIYDTSYIYTQITEFWKRISLLLFVIVVLTILMLVLLQRQIFILPVLKLTDWFKKFQKGEITENPSISRQDEFGKLISEVEQVALSLRIARKVVSEKAAHKILQEELWTERKLKDLIQAKIGLNSFFIVSNREPYMHIFNENKEGGGYKVIKTVGGLVSALDPIMKASGGTWIAHGAGNADKKFVNSKNKLGVPPDDEKYILKRVWLTKQEEEGYYYGFSNEGLWPLCHVTHTRPIFKSMDWEIYKNVNKKFAENILEELPINNCFVFIQDYHFTLLPKILKEKRPDITVAFFWHIPWPNPEIFTICPYYSEILEGMLACDLIGFQTQYNCNNFLETANRLLESRIDTEKFSVIRAGKQTYIKAFPISIADYSDDIIKKCKIKEHQIKKELELEDKIVGIGIDRIDYTKGIAERLNAIDRFFEKFPEYKNKFVFIQIGVPSRIHLKRYQDLVSEIDNLVEKINWKYSDINWKPIIYFKKHFSGEEVLPYYLLANLCMVSSLHDGMNLVAKEYIAAKKGASGMLLLSVFTGAARELVDAIQINPYNIEEFSDSIKMAIEMPEEEKNKRMNSMYNIIKENNVYKWAANIITEISLLKNTK